ncbi:MAG: amidohydrolase family protein [Candidatus Brocadiia bacterium]
MLLRAKYVIPEAGKVIENGYVSIGGHTIKSVSHIKSLGRVYDLGNAVLIPGLINPHAHLEGPELYGGIKPQGAPRLKPPQSFTEWAQKVIKTRKLLTIDFMNKTVAHGYKVCIQNGITTVGDHTHLLRVAQAQLKAPIRRFVFEEIFNLDPVSANVTAKDAKFICRSVRQSPLFNVGFAPHSPYSVSGPLYQKLFSMARSHGCIMSTHLSELKEEVAFTKNGNGKMVGYLKKIARYYDTWEPPFCTPVEYMDKLGTLSPPAFFVHCNYLTPNDIRLLAKSGVSVVFCPNSHRYFGHRNHPFRKLLKAGINVSLGTDGLGSNADLHILKEMKYVAENYNGLSYFQIFKMGTINGARTLNIHKKVGVLKPGYQADIAGFSIRGNIKPKELLPYLIHTAPHSILTMVAGKILKP